MKRLIGETSKLFVKLTDNKEIEPLLERLAGVRVIEKVSNNEAIVECTELGKDSLAEYPIYIGATR